MKHFEAYVSMVCFLFPKKKKRTRTTFEQNKN